MHVKRQDWQQFLLSVLAHNQLYTVRNKTLPNIWFKMGLRPGSLFGVMWRPTGDCRVYRLGKLLCFAFQHRVLLNKNYCLEQWSKELEQGSLPPATPVPGKEACTQACRITSWVRNCSTRLQQEDICWQGYLGQRMLAEAQEPQLHVVL